MTLKKIDKIKLINKYKKKENDVGSSYVQIIEFTEKINRLQNHFFLHKKDFHSQRGLLKMVSKRKKQLNYLKKKDFNKYNKLIKILELRR